MEYRYKPTTNGRNALAACMALEKPPKITRVAFGSGKAADLLHRGLHIPGGGIGHGLDGNRSAAANGHAPDNYLLLHALTTPVVLKYHWPSPPASAASTGQSPP